MSAPANDAQHGLFDETPVRVPEPSPLRRRRLVVEVSANVSADGRGTFATVVRDPENGQVLDQDQGRADAGGQPAAAGVTAGLALARAVDPEAEIEVRLSDRAVVEGLAEEDTAARVIWTWTARGDNRRSDQLLRASLAEAGSPRTL